MKDLLWRDYGSSADAVRIKHGYDRASNRLYRQDPVATAASAKFDELYNYDAVQRLKRMDRGTLNGSNTAITSETFAQCWTLDPTGNWRGFRQDDDGSGTWELAQSRSANAVNEITGITNSVGSAWAQPAYDRAGNMTTIPQPNDPTKSFTATYDAWNRLVKLVDGGDTVSEHAYDGRSFRIVQKSYSAAGVLNETRHLFYNSGWQVLEERLGSSPDSADADRQFVWGLRYIDDLVLRDRDTNGNGDLDERLYALQDPNWNVVAIANSTGDIQERDAYTAYGKFSFLTPAFGSRSNSSFAWETTYCGYRLESATGILHVRNRILITSTGTWGQRDRANDNETAFYIIQMPISSVDPYGMANFPSRPTSGPRKTCVITMREAGQLASRWENEAQKLGDEVLSGACNGSDIVRFVDQHNCCSVTFLGHQGGADNVGGIVTDCDGTGAKRILPSTCLSVALAKVFKKNKCRSCRITIESCGASPGDPNFAEFEDTVQAIANATGCTVVRVVGIHVCGMEPEGPPLTKEPCRSGPTQPPDRRPGEPPRHPIAEPCQ